MSKELLPLEALTEIKEEVELVSMDCDFENCLNIIETALKDYEKKIKLAKEYKDINNVAKRLKALEIIKEKTKYFVEFDDSTKTVFMDCALDCDNQEYELLKEVLL